MLRHTGAHRASGQSFIDQVSKRRYAFVRALRMAGSTHRGGFSVTDDQKDRSIISSPSCSALQRSHGHAASKLSFTLDPDLRP